MNFKTPDFFIGDCAFSGGDFYTLGRIRNHYVVLVQMPGMGKAYAAGVASSLRTSFNGIKFGILVDICGGVLNTVEGTVLARLIYNNPGRRYLYKFVRSG